MLLSLLIAVFAFAGDASTYQTLGFSPDGKYFAFAQTGIQDGSGFPYAQAGVLDVARNKFVANQNIVLEDGTDEQYGTPEQALDKAVAALKLSRFQITRGKNLGQELLVRLPTDHSPHGAAIFSFDYWAEGGASTAVPKYEVVLQEKNAQDESEDNWCTDFLGNSPKMMSLSVLGRESTRGKSQLFQDDRSLPRSRGCVGGYSVKRVITYKGGLVIALSYWGPGFEGPNVRQMVVTGKINFRD